MDEAPTLEVPARRAVDGDRDAVATIVRELQANMYALALRMLWHPQDAEDATQEILVRVVTRLAQFDFKSRLRTWAYRVATNYLLDVTKSCVERQKLSFTSFAEDLAEGLLARRARGPRAVSAHRGGEARLHPRDAAVFGPATSTRVRAWRNPGFARP